MRESKFIKHFNLADARAGAPIGCTNGAGAEILRYLDRKMIGIQVTESGNQYASEWNLDGSYCTASHANAMDLVMLPLGFVQGKPFFVGDEIIGNTGDAFIAEPRDVDGTHDSWRWPAPANVYPKTRMAHEELIGAQGGYSYCNPIVIANAALRHAIDTGQVITTEQANDEARSLTRSFSDARTVREMAIAQAVRRNCVAAYDREMTAHDWEESIGNLDLAKIIASVK